MNWDAIGAIAELLGAIGVIASLVYLAVQIRHGQRAVRASTYQQYRQGNHQAINSALTVPGLASTVSSGLVDFEQLDPEDAFRFTFWINGVMHSYDNACYQYRLGMLDDDRWAMHRADIVQFFETPGVAQWWRSNAPSQVDFKARRGGVVRGGGATYSPEFVALVSEILGEEPDRAD